MRKVIAAMNMTLDGFCDHTAGIPDEALHRHYTDLLNEAGVILYGRVTYQLMEYWRPFLAKPSGEKSMDDFAVAIDRIPKVVFSHTLEEVDWKTATLASEDLAQTIANLRRQPGNDILVGSPGLIAALTRLDLVDEYQLCVHPVIAGGGLPLFRDIQGKPPLTLLHTKIFDSGVILLYYKRGGGQTKQSSTAG